MDPMANDARRRRRMPLAWLAGLLLAPLLVLPSIRPLPAWAEDGAEGQDAEEAEENPLEVCDDEKARELTAELKKIARKKNANDVLPTLEKIEDLRHEDFEKTLLKLLKHESSLVALKVAAMWEWRVRPKIASKLWKASWGEKKNDKRYAVKALVLKGFARAGLEIKDRDFKDIERAWRWIVGNPNPTMAPALVAIAEYVELAKDKRLFRQLAEELDEPGTNVNASDPNNPPAEWWKRRWELWNASKPAVVSALLELTGKEFDKTAEAKAWLEENEKSFGVKW